MAQRLVNGRFPLSYMGVNAVQPSNDTQRAFDPTPNDSQNFYIMDFWLNTQTLDVWILVSQTGGIAKWVKFTGGSGSLLGLTGNTGGFVPPTSGNINILGSGAYTFTGSPGTSTLTLSDNGTNANSFVTSSPVATPTVTGGTATPAANVLNLQGSHNISVSGGTPNTGAANDVVYWLNNAITLGDLSVIATDSNALSCTTGDINIAAGNLKLPNTTAAFAAGTIIFGSDPFIHNYTTSLPNVFIGIDVGNTTLTTANQNFALGTDCLTALTTGSNNICIGQAAGQDITTGHENVCIGNGALADISTATLNTAIGHQAGQHLLTGSGNLMLGVLAGTSLTGSESNNILIGSGGSTGVSATIQIGDGINQTKCYIGGIYGVTTGSMTTSAVLIDNTGQLGTISSSQRFKESIEDLGSKSQAILDLKPKTFIYKGDMSKTKQFGLIAEEVAQVLPEIVNYDEHGPHSVKYHELPVLLLNEFKALYAKVGQLEEELRKIRSENGNK